MTWLELQKKIKDTFENAKVIKFKDILEKDKNGWNWILTFHQLTTETSLIVHTKFIFKLKENKEELRLNEFLYLYDLNCKYRLVKFDNIQDLETLIDNILLQDKFGDNIMIISRLLISPAMTLNNYFYEQNEEDLTIYEFNYDPEVIIAPCQEFKMNFTFNVNNNYVVDMNIQKEKNDFFKISFEYLGNKKVIEIDNLISLNKTILAYIKRELN